MATPDIIVCNECGNVLFFDDGGCAFCSIDNKVVNIKKVKLPEYFNCDECQTRAEWDGEKYLIYPSTKCKIRETRLNAYELPFINIKFGTFYCGCHGWE